MIILQLFLLLVVSINTFLVEITPPSTKCFLLTVYPKENLLLEIETPIFSERVILTIQVFRQGKQ